MDKIDELLTRGVDNILPSKKALEEILRNGKKLRVYQGFDPSTPSLHIGHMIGLKKLAQWQELGHEVIFLIGDFTGMIGDPTGKEETRPLLDKKVVSENAKTYKTQASKILSFNGKNPAKIKFNSEWLGQLSTQKILNLASLVTYQQVIKRDMYRKRIQEDKDISINEIMYPILQGYDSVVMGVDVEVGGRDQLFNMMMGRELMHKMKRHNKFVMTTALLTDAQGNKIGKTTGNAINFSDSPDIIFGAIMNFGDDVITKGLEYLTDVPMEKIELIAAKIKGGQNPLQFKKMLAFEIVAQLNSKTEAEEAEAEFEKVFQKGESPESIPTVTINQPNVELADFLINNNLAASKSAAKRLLYQKAIEIDGQTVKNDEVEFEDNQVLKVGKRKFVRIKIN